MTKTASLFRATKIVATLGPASTTREQIRALITAGVNVVRMNFSHGSHEDHGKRIALVRSIEEELQRPITILADMQGPKLRIGTFAKTEIELKAGQSLRLDLDPTPGDETRVQLPHPEIISALDVGHILLLNDGRVKLEVTACGKDYADTRVVSGTGLSDRKGVNLPGTVLDMNILTPKDLKDLEFALSQGVEYVALSFVQRAEDVAAARKIIGTRAGIVSKIEKPTAVKEIEQIIALSDGIMVARGDLGVELPPEDVPAIQKMIVQASRVAGKPVIVATQMLESMITAPAPTRAEASDVANAVYDGTDAVMLSAETASGQYPIEAVAIMDRICRKVEADDTYHKLMKAHALPHEQNASAAITAATRQVAETIGAVSIVAFTASGLSALRVSRERPDVPVLSLTPSQATARKMGLYYGAYPVQMPDIKTFAETVEHSVRIAKEKGIAIAGDKLVITAGVPFGTSGTTNILRIAVVE